MDPEGRWSVSSGISKLNDGMRVAVGAAMADLILVAVTVAFFALSIAYTRGCDRL
jgi:hypothetical protein